MKKTALFDIVNTATANGSREPRLRLLKPPHPEEGA
jgi:hypothetical protein